MQQGNTAPVPAPTRAAERARARAAERLEAKATGLACRYDAPGLWTVASASRIGGSHEVGSSPDLGMADWTCTCQGGQWHACAHKRRVRQELERLLRRNPRAIVDHAGASPAAGNRAVARKLIINSQPKDTKNELQICKPW